MSTCKKPPVFCDNCSSLALAEADGAPLCAGCLTAFVLAAPSAQMAEQIVPLELKPTPFLHAVDDDPAPIEVA